jgi:hypothetical protein
VALSRTNQLQGAAMTGGCGQQRVAGAAVTTGAAMRASGEVVVQIAPGGVHRLDQRELFPP